MQFDICLSPLCTTNRSTSGANRCKRYPSAYRTYTRSNLDRRSGYRHKTSAVRLHCSCQGKHHACPSGQGNGAIHRATLRRSVLESLRTYQRDPLRRTQAHPQANRACRWLHLVFRRSVCTFRLSVRATSTRSRTVRMEHHCIVFPRPLR